MSPFNRKVAHTLWPRLSLGLLLTVYLTVHSAQAQGPSGSPVSTSPQTESEPIKLTVQKVQLGLEELRDIGLDLKHVLTACRHLYDEVTLQPVSMLTEPEMIANGVLISIPIGVQPVGPPAPPRKERVDLLMNQIRPVVGLLKKNVDDFVAGNKVLDLPDPVKGDLEPEFDQWVSTVNDLDGQLTKLDGLTQGPDYSNYAIAASVSSIEQDIKQLDEIRKKTHKALRQAGKNLNN